MLFHNITLLYIEIAIILKHFIPLYFDLLIDGFFDPRVINIKHKTKLWEGLNLDLHENQHIWVIKINIQLD